MLKCDGRQRGQTCNAEALGCWVPAVPSATVPASGRARDKREREREGKSESVYSRAIKVKVI